jgi:multiple sugar transport system substrate-binding protein
MIEEIVGGLDVAQRWGVADGQLALASRMINSQASTACATVHRR